MQQLVLAITSTRLQRFAAHTQCPYSKTDVSVVLIRITGTVAHADKHIEVSQIVL
jgi:hypothetical protein